MTFPTYGLKINDLPTAFPIFPLSGALLLPGGRLPLNIFEHRYLGMVEGALAGDRFLGMVQPKSVKRETVGDGDPIYDIGCLGRITTFAEAEDGRFFITLQGLTRFGVSEELELENGYRRVRPDYSAFIDDVNPRSVDGFVRQPFVDSLQAYFAFYDIKGSWDALEDADEATLITSVAMAVPFAPEEKQAILECSSLVAQGEMLRSLMEMAVHEAKQGPAPVRH